MPTVTGERPCGRWLCALAMRSHHCASCSHVSPVGRIRTSACRLSVAEPPHPSGLTLEERFQLARSVAEECISDEELRNLLAKKPNPIAYDGFEPSGRMHIAQGVMKVWQNTALLSAAAMSASLS